MEALADLYSPSSSSFFNCLNSFAQSAFFSSKASVMPPHPVYFARASCSCGVASLPSAMIVRRVLIASVLALNLAFGVVGSFTPPFAGMMKFCPFGCSWFPSSAFCSTWASVVAASEDSSVVTSSGTSCDTVLRTVLEGILPSDGFAPVRSALNCSWSLVNSAA